MKQFLFVILFFFQQISSEEPAMFWQLKIESSAFEANGKIPAQYTCEGLDHSPPLKFTGIPSHAKSLALIVQDPDAPVGVFDHWIVWNIPATSTSLDEAASPSDQGTNSFGVTRYRGPCPPRGSPHRYFFTLYALDKTLDLEKGSTKDALLKAMVGHILKQGELIGIYQR